ncbi:translation initiation factor eIF-2B epsilon subunit [Metarhizium album ARSEF 1941]|uniref:Translation initiation factor eIF2B subunit epsilon n=1 Tax=Metarhizium album (strain ARSEF 1941) TaxID=1081103 RepID=A0A0B2X6X1_METAS|nr:translation initiation factor eIF-2B epsilon subunit [Metarhizium album ARSEF 1941]KHO01046.1 translation initiation factor eIF-2B epsilon subunit [Metarhizium album ARSEF 1941]
MSHKGKHSAAKGIDTESHGEDVLQAVCLLPLGNTPIIEYTLEFLAMNGVREVYIYCGAFTDQVEDYIGQSRWATTSRCCPFSVVQFVRLSDARSAGDILRDLDKRSLVDGDFLVVHGDLVSNFMLDGVLAAHRKRRGRSAANIMTVVLRSGGDEHHRTKTNGITPIFAVDANNKRCLQYDEMTPLQSDHYLALDPAIPDELSTEFEIRSDLIDAHIDICTPEVLALWSESFDYELPRRNFLHGVLKDWELNGKMIYAEILEDGYAARASNLQMYDAISRDILGRWTFPFIPEHNLVPNQTYQRHANGLVMEHNVFHAHDARISNAVLAGDTTIGLGSRISNCFIGSGCKIGANVVLEDSYVWDNTIISDGTRISRSIVGDSVLIGKGCTLPPGSLVGSRVQIGDDITLNKSSILSVLTPSGEPVSKDTELLGASTNAAALTDLDDEDDLDERDASRLQRSLIYSLADLNLSTSTISTLAFDAGSDSDADDNFLFPGAASSSRSRLSSFASDDSAGKLSFHADAVHGLLDALRGETSDFDGAKLEFMGLRLANDASDGMMREAIATAFALRAAELLTPEHGSLEPTKAAEKALTLKKGATAFIGEVGVGGEESEQVEYILATQKALQRIKNHDQARLSTLLAAMLQQLYVLDILEEDGILGWWQDGRAADGAGMAALKANCKVLIEWLENAEEEGEGEDEDSEDEQ